MAYYTRPESIILFWRSLRPIIFLVIIKRACNSLILSLISPCSSPARLTCQGVWGPLFRLLCDSRAAPSFKGYRSVGTAGLADGQSVAVLTVKHLPRLLSRTLDSVARRRKRLTRWNGSSKLFENEISDRPNQHYIAPAAPKGFDP